MTPGRAYGDSHRRMATFAFSLGGTGPEAGGGWSFWGRGDTRRFEAGLDGTSHDGTLTGLHLGADLRAGKWLAGVSVMRSAADADYRFERSVVACGGGGTGEGLLETDVTSVHPYAGRQVGRGWLWATAGAGSGEVSVERCESGHVVRTDMSLRLAALGGRHPFAVSDRLTVSVVEDIGVLKLTTGASTGPAGDRSASVGRVRLGLEAAGTAPPDCDCTLTTYVRALARGDWGDGATGTGLELAAGVRYRHLPRRLGVDAGIEALAAHSAEDVTERSANVTLSILPKADGTGLQVSLVWRRGTAGSGVETLDGLSPWADFGSAPLAGGRVDRNWTVGIRLGFGRATRRGLATPFAEFDAAGQSGRGGGRIGMRHEYGDRERGLRLEWSFGSGGSGAGGSGNDVTVSATARF